jgi:hypothetical protein
VASLSAAMTVKHTVLNLVGLEVYKVGDRCDLDVKVGQWILIEHGRWTRKIKINDGER